MSEVASDQASWYPAAADFDTPERRRLASALRTMIDAAMTVDAPADELERTADTLEELAAAFRHDQVEPHGHFRSPPSVRTHGDYLPRSPYVGHASPLAPPIEVEIVDGRCCGDVTFGAAYEGPPGHVHGGVITSAFDEMLGIANVAAGYGAMTAVLTTRYRRPTPLHVPLRFEAWTDRVEGRRVIAKGKLLRDDTVLAEADGTFVQLQNRHRSEYFGSR
jgi:acyl-coenzyme A thioesterase PaaI-like protein